MSGSVGIGGAGAGGAGNAGSAGNGGAGSSGAAGASGSAASCTPIEESPPLTTANHVTPCTYVDYASNPPSSGDHYPVPTQHKTYTTPVVRGFWVHNLEHGGVVFSYNCPSGCDAEVAMLQAIIDAFPVDPLCEQSGFAKRVLMTPDPHLDVKFAASAWGFVLRSDCMNPSSFSTFLSAHYNMGPEQVCWDGPDQSVGQPDGCGEPGFMPDGG
jgi:hypothetical protein